MGCGSSKKVEAVRVKTAADLSYPKQMSLTIKERNAANEVVKTMKVDCALPPAYNLLTKEVTIANTNVFVSACVLPGIDPKGTIPKSCQDRFIVAYDGVRLLAGAFDGHGGSGHDCAQFLTENISNYFTNAAETEKRDLKAFMIKMTDKVNDDLVRSPAETQHSGSTAVLMMIDDLRVYTGCVGDSRACLATRKVPTKDPNEFEQSGEEALAPCLEELRKKRRFANSHFHAMQLSKDSKPNDPDEMFRIFRAGGKVDRAKRPNGQPYGPYRVFGKAKDVPGLAMSRSLGDTASRDSGVVSTPIVTTHILDLETDYFAVAGSDGIWDVMTNEEVIDFIEYFRRYSKKNESLPRETNPHECTIAQLICEEARVRWLSLVEEEDVLIDDISAVVVEFKPPIIQSATQPQSPLELSEIR
mmetsp:Transcript_1633/g.3520  ORF Transcript_1633/g.3520 Transcript_1633/m.3520 type:complete len:415 (-) Transcript_1633:38-1282(-)|eukprot:CAMPEP_0204901316 /NCGR_PEP_ID=MMETSP1397-20131031/3018_1 /ASSEMBLY_ACC=CAM_ASM_000891 /TAXON_ID=49980 /ORGANISM="Climacostomum Climacostomum virens, Strain Stock W-24" /LENGTH=414 /DNA_ID=CAMNT_0052069667 /DNA_START=279 /DNA_END=1519 /DNA_ORIENTATION=+